MENVILVNEWDEEIGQMEKLEAHRQGKLHRAFSILVYNSKGEMLLQRRAFGKYHSGGLWTNACCSHPKPNEETALAAKRRLKEEMGIGSNPVFVYKFIYKATLDNGLTEHEYDHVFTCSTDEPPILNPNEADDYKYIGIGALMVDIRQHPETYTTWFKIIMERFNDQLQSTQ
ncbi:MAG TPA: isopentenyl-diphosphate Delta-isomerase [Fulvivirga sp.]|nr:isopentenyl-diphosphate Delta-isomerase [Fulvivirga sp.]